MSGVAGMRLLFNVRFGTECYPDKVARRLRTVNFGTRIAAAGHAFFLVLSLAYFVWWLALVHTVMLLLFAGVPLLHRLGPRVGGVTFCSLRS